MDHTTSAMDEALLREIRRRRTEFRESLDALRAALAADTDDVRWLVRVHVALVELSADLTLHVRVSEREHGLHNEIKHAAPRLTGPVDRLAEDHRRIRGLLDELLLAADSPFAVPDVEGMRTRAAALIEALARHRQRGADLVYEAFQVDLGGET